MESARRNMEPVHLLTNLGFHFLNMIQPCLPLLTVTWLVRLPTAPPEWWRVCEEVGVWLG